MSSTILLRAFTRTAYGARRSQPFCNLVIGPLNKQPPNQELDTAPDCGDEPKPEGEILEAGMRKMPTDPPAVIPSAASEQTVIAAGMGLGGFAKQDPEGGLTGIPKRSVFDPTAADTDDDES